MGPGTWRHWHHWAQGMLGNRRKQATREQAGAAAPAQSALCRISSDFQNERLATRALPPVPQEPEGAGGVTGVHASSGECCSQTPPPSARGETEVRKEKGVLSVLRTFQPWLAQSESSPTLGWGPHAARPQRGLRGCPRTWPGQGTEGAGGGASTRGRLLALSPPWPPPPLPSSQHAQRPTMPATSLPIT